MYKAHGSNVVTYRPDGTSPRFLGTLGHVGSLTYSDTMPGGCDSLSCVLQIPITSRTDAIDPGRIVRVYRGASNVWTGILQEPTPDESGWNLTAKGTGTYGDNFKAYYQTWDANDPIDHAILRGIGWTNPGINEAVMYTSQVQDPASDSITDHLNLITTPGSYTWHVDAYGTLNVLPIPTTVTRILVATSPVARVLAGYVNSIWVRYMLVADSDTTTAQYGINSVTNQASVNQHGRLEEYWDLSGAGVCTTAQAQALCAAALIKYQAATYAGGFTVRPTQYLTANGVPVDLGCEKAGEVCRLILMDGSYGGEVAPCPPITFPVGKVEYDDMTGTAQITPFQNVKNDLAGLLSAMATVMTPQEQDNNP